MNKFFISGLRKEANPGQPSWWEKPLYAIRRAIPHSFAKPTSQKMFDPKDNPEQYHRDVYNMAKAREERHAKRHINNAQRLVRLNDEIRDSPWRKATLAPYLDRAERLYMQTRLDPAHVGRISERIGEPGSVNAMNFIDNIKYGNPTIGQYADKYRY